MKKLLFCLLILTWGGIAGGIYYTTRHGGYYDYTKSIGTVNGQQVPLYSLIEVYALTRPENISEVILRELIRQKAVAAGVPYKNSNRKEVLLTLGTVMEKSLSAKERAAAEAARLGRGDIFELECLFCKPDAVEYVRRSLVDFTLSDIAMRNDDPHRLRPEKRTLGELEKSYGTAAREVVSHLKPGTTSQPVAVPNGFVFFHLIGKTNPNREEGLGQFLVRTQGWEYLRSSIAENKLQFARFSYEEKIMKQVFQDYLDTFVAGK